MSIIKFLWYCVLICLLYIRVESKRILGIFPHFGYSHFKVFYPLLRNLADRGHNLTVITYVKTQNLPNGHYEELILEGTEIINVVPLTKAQARTWKGLFDEYIALHYEGQKSCERLYESGFVEQILQNYQKRPFDLVITEYYNSDCQMALPYLLKTPVVALSSCLLMPWYYDRILLPDTPSFIQSEFVGFRTPLIWHERLMNFVQAKVLSLLYLYYTNFHDNRLIKKYLNIDIDVAEIAKQNTRLIFGNQHYSLMGVRPLTQQFIEVGGIHITDEDLNRELPPSIENFLGNSKKNALFISWGSMIKGSSLAKEKLQAIVNVVKKLDMKVVWKWETDEVPIKNDQFMFLKWAPQLALVCNPKITLFWGHGGLLSTTEAVYCGKKMLLTPIYGDQFVNAFAVENRKIGRIISFNNIDEKALENEIKQLLHSNYTSMALQISKIFRDRESKPLDTATWWVEHVLEHNVTSEVLHSYAVDLNWFVYYSLDAITLIFSALLVSILLIKILLRLIIIRSRRTKFDKVKQN